MNLSRFVEGSLVLFDVYIVRSLYKSYDTAVSFNAHCYISLFLFSILFF